MVRRRHWRSDSVRRFMAAAQADDPIVAVRRKASELVRPLTGPPFRLDDERILRAANIKSVRYSRTVPGDGRIFLEGDTYIVEINASRSSTRRAFTLAHELAHTFFLPLEVRKRVVRADAETERFNRDDEEEFLCDVAAAEMLMPTKQFVRDACLYGPSSRTIMVMARIFGTSLTSTARRFAEAEAWRCHIGFWQIGRDRTARYQFGFGSNSIEYVVPRRAAALPDSVVAEAAVGGGTVRRRKLRGNDTVVCVAVFERHPEQLFAMFDVESRRRTHGASQASFRFFV